MPELTDSLTPDQALALAGMVVRHDLQATRAWSATTEAIVVTALAERRWWVQEWPEGAEHVAGLVAQDVQEAVHATVDQQWPPCPEHPDHALFVEPDLGPDPFWVCHRSGLPVAPVGSL